MAQYMKAALGPPSLFVRGIYTGNVTERVSGKHRLEYIALRVFVQILQRLPRKTARRVGAGIGWLAYRALRRLREVGQANLCLAFPESSAEQRDEILQRVYRHLGWQMAEFCRMSSYGKEDVRRFIRYEGLENFESLADRGKGVMVLTGHLGAWELSSFYHSLMGSPMDIVIRRLDNPVVDGFVNRVRCLHSNRVLHKDDFARGLIESMRSGRTVGVLMDTNMTPPQGVFVPFFGKLACTASGVARIARKTGAAVLPGFLLWEEAEQGYVLRFGEEVPVTATEDAETDALENTARFTAVLESYIRAYPEQWLWMHRRWKTRPEGEARMYTV